MVIDTHNWSLTMPKLYSLWKKKLISCQRNFRHKKHAVLNNLSKGPGDLIQNGTMKGTHFPVILAFSRMVSHFNACGISRNWSLVVPPLTG